MPEPAADRYARPWVACWPPPGAAPPAGTPVPAASPSETVEASPTKRLGLIGWFSILWLGGITLLAVLAPWLPLPDPDKSFLEIGRSGPVQPGHVLGGDGSGRDMLSRVISAPGRRSASACPPSHRVPRSGGMLGCWPATSAVDSTRCSPACSTSAVHPGAGARPVPGRHLRQRPAGRVERRAVGGSCVAALAIVTVPLLAASPGQRDRLVRARVRQGRRGLGRRPRAHPPTRGAAQRAARPWCPSPCSASRWPSSPRAAWPCSASASPRCRRGEHDRLRPLRPGPGAPHRGGPVDRHLPHRARPQLPGRRGPPRFDVREAAL